VRSAGSEDPLSPSPRTTRSHTSRDAQRPADPPSVRPGAIRRAGAWWPLLGLSLLATASLGALLLPHPFHGDQALFLYGARVLDRGGVLYRDFWDNKQPGIYWFFLAAGRAFGFDEVGVHLFELLYMLAFAAVLAMVMRRLLDHWWLALAVPVATVGTYYAIAGTWHLTQLEILVGFPLFLTLWWSTRLSGSRQARRRALFASGLAAGVVACFKLVLSPLPALFWVLAAARVWAPNRRAVPGSRRMVLAEIVRDTFLPALLGTAVVLAGVALWFWWRGALHELLWTWFVYPILASREVPAAPATRVVSSLTWSATRFGVWLPLALIPSASLAFGRRHRDDRPAQELLRDRLVVGLYVWLLGDVAVILAQKFSLWAYHFLLLLPPITLLAVRGIDILTTAVANETESHDATRVGAPHARWRTPHTSGVAAAFLLLVCAMGGPLRRWYWTLQGAHECGWTLGSGRLAYQRCMSADYARIWPETALLRDPRARPGAIYVFGNPLYLRLSGRSLAIPTHGWAWEVFLESQWRPLAARLQAAAPAYVVVEKGYERYISAHPVVRRWLARRYAPCARGPRSTWYCSRPGDHG
jgi:hypothetical protein